MTPATRAAGAELVGVPLVSAGEARALTEQLRQSLTVAWELLVEAYQCRAWAALGYASWDAYTDAELGEVRLRLPREQRREVVASMTEAGMSTRAIGSALGVDPMTVSRDRAGVANATPAPARDTAAEFADFVKSTEFDDVVDAEIVDDDPHDGLAEQAAAVQAPPVEQVADRVQGTDGKSYPSAAPKPVASPRRRALTQSFWEASYDLAKHVEKVTRLAADDRFPEHRRAIAASHTADIVRDRDAIEDLLRRLSR